LNDWLAEFSDDFPGSTLLLVSIGVGSFNQGQIGYFDDVEIVHDDYQAAYDFEPAIGPPEDKDACKNGGWMTFNNPSFRNQGDCVSFVVSNGKAKRQS
jgi:glucuronoarabinoxylan endo-1,4-beta-xylanase